MHKVIVVVFEIICLCQISCLSETPFSPDTSEFDFTIVTTISSGNNSRQVWKVYDDGQIELLDFQITQGYHGTSGIGDTNPLLTPDRSKVAFTSNHNLWIYNFASSTTEQITFVGQPTDSIFISIDILISGFSLDNTKILYYVTHGSTFCEGCDHGTQVREVEYGFFIHDLNTKQSKKVDFPRHFMGWVFKENILLKNDDENDITLYVYSPGTEQITALFTNPNRLTQPDISLDGKSMAATAHRAGEVQIIQVNLLSGFYEGLTEFRSFAQLQWPKFSPSSRKIAYSKAVVIENNKFTDMQVVVDNQSLHQCPNFPRYFWINDEILAIYCLREIGAIVNEITVVDVNTGKIISNHQL